ncbi:hypothetical protein [Rhizobium sp. G21]|uniref:hypothetical protein n=1 Tax=Rhizobium sp. G21 TaxID=2758439 RepID=UPI001FEDA00B|nr:hypothetical protein [Rhizobium sp. G21]
MRRRGTPCVRLPVKATFHDMPAWFVRRRAFGWADASATIVSGFSIYHAALSRRLLNRIRKRFGDVWFGHPIVDYDAALKTAAEGEAFVYCTRPFSTFGACPEANSAALYDLTKLREAHDRFDRETGRETDRDPWLSDFPFPTTLGLPAAVGQVQMWLTYAHGVAMEPGWEANSRPRLRRLLPGLRGQGRFRGDIDGLAGGVRAVARRRLRRRLPTGIPVETFRRCLYRAERRRAPCGRRHLWSGDAHRLLRGRERASRTPLGDQAGIAIGRTGIRASQFVVSLSRRRGREGRRPAPSDKRR